MVEKNITIWGEMIEVDKFYTDNNREGMGRGVTFIKRKIKYEDEYYDLLRIHSVIPDDHVNKNIWIITNTHADNDYALSCGIYIVPGYAEFDGAFYLSCYDLDKLEQHEKIDSVVSKFLHQRCTLAPIIDIQKCRKNGIIKN